MRERTRATRAWNQMQFRHAHGPDALSRCQLVDIETYLPYDNLAKVDIASMAHGLEVRVPLLDHQLLETVARMPSEMRLRQLPGADGAPEWCGKYALKRVASRFHPWEMLTAQKRGFSVPVGEWLGGAQQSFVRERLAEAGAGLSEWFDLEVIRELLAEHGKVADHGHRLWALLVLAEWRRAEAA